MVRNPNQWNWIGKAKTPCPLAEPEDLEWSQASSNTEWNRMLKERLKERDRPHSERAKLLQAKAAARQQ
ncbi:hypothetical protein PtA15_11A503 [Puccinia triticina]|uniref:CBF1-interacting co-repressor CIR N-terminal domain-containing protein n=1 Tax=Puccinia triticina TaxID=208348 RepID=A0ABY7CZF4_9BASI|nr:uncharacterized protein PtA15_11A503 [Puccinia triticina]WAQ89812.1 hypothetical protein PtA15_11A503 [Puccinia triticina]WAR59855.1 hypothetical protein PtB15_11B496 [Puccinia triticina]